MTGLLLQIGATKLAVSVVLAATVWMVHRHVDRPAISYPLSWAGPSCERFALGAR